MCASIIHSVDASLAHQMLFDSDFDICCVHDAFACHATNVGKMRELFVENLSTIHIVGRLYDSWKIQVAGLPLLEQLGIEVNEANPDVAIETREFSDSASCWGAYVYHRVD